MNAIQTSNRPKGWNPWPVSIACFFSLAILSSAAFIWFCSRNPVDLVTADYYEQELRYQSQIDRLENAQIDAPDATVSYDAPARSIIVALPSASVAGVSGRIHLYRPSSEKLDREFTLEPDSRGTQRIDASSLAPGLWKVRVSWTVGKTGYLIDRKIVIDSQTS